MMHIEDEAENKNTDMNEDIPIPGDPESAKKTLIELWTGIILYGVLLEITAVWFFENKAAASITFWIGIVTALCMALHMYKILDRVLSDAEGSQGIMSKTMSGTLSLHSILRYIVVIIVLGVVQYRGIGSPVITFFGIMGLKAGAYLQPFVHKAMIYLKTKSNRNEVRR